MDYWLNTWVEDPVDWEIDDYTCSTTQPGNSQFPFSCLYLRYLFVLELLLFLAFSDEMRADFEKKITSTARGRAKKKADLAARKTAEAQRKAEAEATIMTREATSRGVVDSTFVEGLATNIPNAEDSEDHIPLNTHKRKAPALSGGVIVLGEGRP